MNTDDILNDSDDEQEKSKSQLKREVQALYDLGVQLSKLPPKILARIPMSDELRDAITTAANTKSNSAHKRQLLYVGKVLRNSDIEEIHAEFEKINEEKARATRQLHQVEQWRDELLSNNKMKESEFFTRYQNADRQVIRQLIRNANKEKQHNKAPTSARKLFKTIQDTLAKA